MSLLYGPGYTPFRMSSQHLFLPEELEEKLRRFNASSVKTFLQVEGFRIALAPGDFPLAAKVASAFHAGVTDQAFESDHGMDYADSDPEDADEGGGGGADGVDY